MVFITENLVRKRAEHNNMQLSTLEEVSLHQLDIEKIEYIDKWCRELKILYLQSNLIPKIENVGKLKKLEYLNLALNNIETIENLEGCESLSKVDLTVNFISQITSIETLKKNEFLRDLYLTGNPCTDFEGYREYVVATLTQLTHLDGKEISKSERIEAVQSYGNVKAKIIRQQKEYLKKKQKEKEAKKLDENQPGFNKQWYTDTENAHLQKEEEKKGRTNDDFWSKPTKYTPESRIETHRYMEEQRKQKEKESAKFLDPNPPKRVIRYFHDDGSPFNINQAQLDFKLQDNEMEYVLDLPCYKHLGTSLIDVDVQPSYIRVVIKGKIFQLVLNDDVSPDSSTAQRSQTTGHLVVAMPKLSAKLSNQLKTSKKHFSKNLNLGDGVDEKGKNSSQTKVKQTSQKLEVDDKKRNDIFNIVGNEHTEKKIKKEKNYQINEIRRLAEIEFVDDPTVPPLM